ncbi:MAG: beta-glucuronidase [Prevotella sp.]|nr:beta-glucuronidase [Prevotella sp.]
MKRTSLLLACALSAMTMLGQQVLNLAGSWDFAMGDHGDAATATTPVASATGGLTPPARYSDYVMLPGSMLTNGKGLPVSINTQWTGSLYDSSYYFNPAMEAYRHEGNMKFPFFLTPEHHYVGAAWYHRKVYVPRDWRGQEITLFLERPHIETTVWVNGREVGHQMSLSVPHRFNITRYIKAGRQNDIAIRVYNGIENVGVGQDSHSVTDQTQGNWNGITGRMELQAQWKALNVKRVRVIPADEDLYAFRVVVDIENHIPEVRMFPLYDYYVEVAITPVGAPAGTRPMRIARKIVENEEQVEMVFLSEGDPVHHTRHQNDILPWDEFHPNLYQLTVRAGDDVYQTTFGLRHIGIEGRQFTINGRPLFLRGTVENCCFPLTGYPPTEVEPWLDIFRKCKEYGLNHVRFHSYCPPEAAFQAADQVGIYVQAEGPSWPNHGVKLRRGQIIDEYLLEESKRIVDEYGHHPSFVMMAAGNEPAGDWVSYCNDWVSQMHQYDSTRVYCGASVGGGWAWDGGSEYHVKAGARGLDWDRHAPQSMDDYYTQIEFPRNYNLSTPNNSPIIAHEHGQWCAFPDLDEVSQYTGAYKAGNFEIFRDLLERGGMASQARNFLMASGRLQTLCYKYEIERNLRTPDYAGFQLLGLNDYSGQGTALVGPLNVFWREKGYVNAAQWREFCNSLVVLAQFPRFIYTTADTLKVPISVMNALYGNLTPCAAVWQVWQNDSSLFASDTLSVCPIALGKNNALGTVVMPLSSIQKATKMTLRVTLGNAVQNHWDFWVYPTSPTAPTAPTSPTTPHIADSLTAEAIAALRSGGTVLITAAGKVTLGSDVKQTYLPVFWNTSWFKMRPPHTTGAYIDKSHPLFSYDFPTDDWANLNWWELLNRAQVMNLMELPASYQPPIQPIDTWHVSRKLGMLIEARVLGGRLLMTTMDISTDLQRRHVARQMRQAILRYMQSSDFQPSIELDLETLQHFFTRQAPPVDMFTNDSPDELKPKIGS